MAKSVRMVKGYLVYDLQSFEPRPVSASLSDMLDHLAKFTDGANSAMVMRMGSSQSLLAVVWGTQKGRPFQFIPARIGSKSANREMVDAIQKAIATGKLKVAHSHKKLIKYINDHATILSVVPKVKKARR